MPTGPSAARFPLPVRRRASWGSPCRLICEWSECHAGPHLDRDAKINCCRRRGLVRPAVASYLNVLSVCACPACKHVCVYVTCAGIDTAMAARGAVLDSGTDGYHNRVRDTADLRAVPYTYNATSTGPEGPWILSPPAC